MRKSRDETTEQFLKRRSTKLEKVELKRAKSKNPKKNIAMRRRWKNASKRLTARKN